VDEFTVRDHENFAMIPGSEIKGLVRDSCVRLLDRLGEWQKVCEGQKNWRRMSRLMEGVLVEEMCGMKGEPLCVMCALFGSPATPGSWWFSEATYSEEYRELVKGADPNLVYQTGNEAPSLAYRDMSTSAHASIHPHTGRADEDHLFTLETVRARRIWEGQIEPFGPSEHSRASESELLGWLAAALLFTRRLGGRRRRGWGRCRFDVFKVNQAGNDLPGNVAALQALDIVFSESEVSDGV
jgi:CRISPR/Cas system CSM-associated protein Csm3 (group 7 of RAMP superfamily)